MLNRLVMNGDAVSERLKTYPAWQWQRPSVQHWVQQTTLDGGSAVVTCYLRYIIDPFKLKEFEHYGTVKYLLSHTRLTHSDHPSNPLASRHCLTSA